MDQSALPASPLPLAALLDASRELREAVEKVLAYHATSNAHAMPEALSASAGAFPGLDLDTDVGVERALSLQVPPDLGGPPGGIFETLRDVIDSHVERACAHVDKAQENFREVKSLLALRKLPRVSKESQNLEGEKLWQEAQPWLDRLSTPTDESLEGYLGTSLWLLTPPSLVVGEVAEQVVTPESLLEALDQALPPSSCSESWTEQHYFYRCRDCSLSAAGSICIRCFELGDHEGHDIVFERSSFGGCCDCGNAQVWKSSGFCSTHTGVAKPNSLSLFPHPAARVIAFGILDFWARICEAAEVAFVLLAERNKFSGARGTLASTTTDLSLGASNGIGAFQAVVQAAQLLSSAQAEDSAMSHPSVPSLVRFCSSMLSFFRLVGGKATVMMQALRQILCSEASGIATLAIAKLRDPPFMTLAGRLAGNENWSASRADLSLQTGMSASKYPEKCSEYIDILLVFFLELLLDASFKEAFLPAYVCAYDKLVEMASEGDANILYKLSPQLLCITDLVSSTYVRRTALLTACIRATAMAFREREANVSFVGDGMTLKMIDCSSRFVVKRWYYAFTNDVNMLCQIPEVALDAIVTTPHYFKDFVHGILVPCHFLDPAQRQTRDHVEFDRSMWKASTGIEWEISRSGRAFADNCARLLRSRLLQEGPEIDVAARGLKVLQTTIADVANAVMDLPTTEWLFQTPLRLVSDSLPVSLHLPVHRMYSRLLTTFLGTFCQSVTGAAPGSIDVEELVGVSLGNFDVICCHPLQCFVVCAQQQARMWVRNGQGFAMQCALYAGNHDRDLLQQDLALLQILAASSDSFFIFDRMITFFEAAVFGWPSGSEFSSYDTIPDASVYSLSAITAFLRLWREMQVDTQRIGMPLEHRLRREMIQQFAGMGDRGFKHSQIDTLIEGEVTDYLQGTGREEQGEDAAQAQEIAARLLQSLTVARPGKLNEPTRHVLKEDIWDEVDPFYRFPTERLSNQVHQTLETHLEGKFQLHAHKNEDYVRSPPLSPVSAPLWRLRGALHFEGLHFLLLVCLELLVTQDKMEVVEEDIHAACDSLLHTVCDMLNLVLDNQESRHHLSPACSYFPGNNLMENACFVKAESQILRRSMVENLCLLLTHSDERSIFVVPVLNRLVSWDPASEIVQRLLPQRLCRCSLSNDTSSDIDPADRRRQEAKLRQERIMNQMKASQQSFVAASGDFFGDPDSQEERDEDDAGKTVGSDVCALCHKEGTRYGANGGEAPMGVVCLLLSTCRGTHDKLADSSGAAEDWWKSEATHLFHTPERGDAEHDDGRVRVTSCGHKLHYECYESFQRHQLRDFSPQLLAWDRESADSTRGEYRCPMCRRLSNALLPDFDVDSADSLLLPPLNDSADSMSDVGSTDASSSRSDQTDMADTILDALTGGETLFDLKVPPRSSADVPVPLGHVSTRLMNIAGNQHSNEYASSVDDTTPAVGSLPVFVFVCGMNIQALDVIARHHLSSSGSFPEFESQAHAVQLLAAGCATAASEFASSEFSEDATQLARASFSHAFPSGSLSWTGVCNALCVDPFVQLSQCVLLLPAHPDIHDRREVLVSRLFSIFYGLCFTQSMIWSAQTLFPDEKFVSHAHALTVAFDNGESVLSTVRELCLPFLRCAALLKFCVTRRSSGSGLDIGLERNLADLKLPSVETLLKEGNSEDLPTKGGLSARFVQSMFGLALEEEENVDPTALRLPNMRLHLRANDCFRFIGLPETYQELIVLISQSVCGHCGTSPKDGAICLFCGRFVCVANSCCSWGQDGVSDPQLGQPEMKEAFRHFAQKCKAARRWSGGLYLLTRSGHILLMWERRYSVLPALYVDEHGEEDAELRRGKPLYLHRDRMNDLLSMWVSQKFDDDSAVIASLRRSPQEL